MTKFFARITTFVVRFFRPSLSVRYTWNMVVFAIRIILQHNDVGVVDGKQTVSVCESVCVRVRVSTDNNSVNRKQQAVTAMFLCKPQS